MVHIVCRITIQLSWSLGFSQIDSTLFGYLLNSVSHCHNFLQIKLRKADSAHHLRRLCRLCSSFGVLEPCLHFGDLCRQLAVINLRSNKLSVLFPAFGAPAPASAGDLLSPADCSALFNISCSACAVCIFSCPIDSVLACTLCSICSC